MAFFDRLTIKLTDSKIDASPEREPAHWAILSNWWVSPDNNEHLRRRRFTGTMRDDRTTTLPGEYKYHAHTRSSYLTPSAHARNQIFTTRLETALYSGATGAHDRARTHTQRQSTQQQQQQPSPNTHALKQQQTPTHTELLIPLLHIYNIRNSPNNAKQLCDW